MPGRIAVTAFATSGPLMPGHDDVGDEQVDRLGVPAQQLERRRPVAGLQHGVARRLEDLRDQLAHDRLVLDEQDRLARRCGGRRTEARIGGCLECAAATRGSQIAERGAHAGRRVDLDRAAALLDDPVDGREPEAGPAVPSS